MQKIIVRTLVLTFVLSFIFVGLLPSAAVPTQGVQAQDGEGDSLRVALVIGTGSQLMDGGFNESSWDALLRAEEELDAEIENFQPIDPEDAIADMTEIASGGYDVIVAVGIALEEPTMVVAPQFPDVHFIGVDIFQPETVENVTGLIFPEDEAGFLAGVLAASLTETNTVGGLFGTDDVPPVVAFREGYESGIRWTEQELDREIEVIAEYHPGTVLDSFSDPQWGASMAAQQLALGADVIFTAAGGTGIGVLEEVAFVAEDGERAFCIGVDSDQWQTLPQAHPCLVSSAVKRVEDGVFELLTQYVDGEIAGGNFVGEVGLAPFYDFADMIDEDTQDFLQRVQTDLETNSILTCYGYDMSELSIGMVMDIDQRIDDGSFNESVWNGMQAAAFCGAEIDFVESQSPSDYATNIAEFAENDFDMIVTVGFALAQDTNAAAEAFPDIRFIGVDQFQAEVTEGVTGMVFYEQDAGFLAGVLAANLTDSGIVAGVYGSDTVPPVVAFKEGYEAGVRYVDEDISVISTFHPGGVDVAFSDPQWGATTARQALDQNADVVFAAGGATGNGSLIEVATVGENPPYCIGVDTDQWLTVPEAHPCLVSSAQKLLDAAMADMALQHVRGTLEDGNYFGLVGLAPFHAFEDVVPEDLQAELDMIATMLADDELDPADY
jgi:basic membrane protein A and related proteins